jgi:hypothetical protein
MAGRPNLVVTQDELSKLYQHIKTLPFHKIIEQNFLREYEINPEKLLTQNLALVKKCRYEKNDFDKRMTYLNLLKQSTKPTQLEQSILALEKLSTTSADAYFTMHKSLDQLKRSAKNEFLEKNIAVEVQKALDPKIAENKAESRNQRNAELIFLGAAVKKLLAESDTYKNRTDIERIGIALKTAMLVEFGKKHFKGFNSAVEQFEARPECQKINQLINEIYKDPRNPHKQ